MVTERTYKSVREMAKARNKFLSEWCEKFPGVEIPDVNFFDDDDVMQRLMTCRNWIKHLEDRLKQEKLYLQFLQVRDSLTYSADVICVTAC